MTGLGPGPRADWTAEGLHAWLGLWKRYSPALYAKQGCCRKPPAERDNWCGSESARQLVHLHLARPSSAVTAATAYCLLPAGPLLLPTTLDQIIHKAGCHATPLVTPVTEPSLMLQLVNSLASAYFPAGFTALTPHR